jgi:hypothetical protein
MEISKGFVAGVALLSVVAGAGSTWVATRSEPAVSEAASPVEGVETSEAVIAPEPTASTPVAPKPAVASPAPVVMARQVERPRPARPVANASRPAPTRKAAPEPILSPPAIAPIVTAPAPMVEPEPLPLPVPRYEELEVEAESVLGLQIDSSVSSERARVEDLVTARVTRDVHAGDRVAIPAGSRVEGEVTLVERGGRLKERARLGVRFTSVVLADGTRVPIATDTIYREGDAPSGESAAKIGGGAIGGAIIGGILGGAKGAIIGGSAGAGAGTAAVLAGGRNPATLPSGTPVTVRLAEPAVVTVER